MRRQAAAAFASPAGARSAKLAKSRARCRTTPSRCTRGNLTRVRAGPFATREAADKALEQLKDLGLKPGTVAAKAG